jgi:hypothetical protein
LAEAAVQGNAAGVNAASASTVTISNARGRAESPITALQDDNIPNLYLGTMDPMQTNTKADAPVDPKVDAHRSLFYQQIEEHYKTTSTRALMSRNEMDAMVQLFKENTKTRNSSEYKLKRDFAVITFDENHYSVVWRKDVTDKDVVDVSELPRYCCYDDLFGAIHKCHVDQEGHSGIRKTEAAVKRHYVNISRAMVEKFIASLESFRNNYHNYASATNMPVDLVRGSVGTNSVQVVPINEVVASLTSTPIGLRTQPYARARTSYSPTFNGESGDNHEEKRESQGDTQEDSKSQGTDKES